MFSITNSSGVKCTSFTYFPLSHPLLLPPDKVYTQTKNDCAISKLVHNRLIKFIHFITTVSPSTTISSKSFLTIVRRQIIIFDLTSLELPLQQLWPVLTGALYSTFCNK